MGNRSEGANTMIIERGARPDALPKPKRGKTTLAVVVLVGVGALALGLGFGAGASLNAIGALGSVRRMVCATPPLSARERFLACTVSEAPVPTPQELEWMLGQRQGRAATPGWGVP